MQQRKEEMTLPSFRRHQKEADEAIYQHLVLKNNDKCLVKMFCGTGKSLLMRKCKIVQKKNLCVYVFSSLGLIEQFTRDYLNDHPMKNLLKICSEVESTTDPIAIKKFLKIKSKKIICVTYQSFKTLVDNLNDIRIDVCIFDEAHNAVGETYQTYIFENQNNVCDKQVFMTATPKNANGITMCDPESKTGACGKLVYEYTYLQGVNDDILNPFEIRIDMFTENCNKSLYECIARAIMASGNGRVLTFHGGVDTDSDTCVNNFLNEREFISCFEDVQRREFPEKNGYYQKITMTSLSSSTPSSQREDIFRMLDETPDNEVIVVSSCQVLREGIDTKRANMCVFVDPKSSSTQIIQNIGRILRKTQGILKPNSTILLPCWVDKEKYLACDGDREKCDAVIREDMDKTGNFNGILNVMSALKQEDEELYDICLHYPDTYSPQEIKSNLEKQGFQIVDPVDEEGNLQDNLEHVLDTELDMEEYEDCETDEELLMRVAEDKDVCIEIHTNSLENPIERYNTECESGDVVRLYKSVDEETEEEMYQPIVSKGGKKRGKGTTNPPDRNRRLNVKVHTNPDVKVLWNVVEGFDLTKDVCSCVIDCEVVKQDPMEVAMGIVERAKLREANGGKLLPRQIQYKNKFRSTPELEQQHLDARRLERMRKKCRVDVRNYLNTELPGWDVVVDWSKIAMRDAILIVERATLRQSNGSALLPKRIRHKEKRQYATQEKIQEHCDYQRLSGWKKPNKKCPKNVIDYLDLNLSGWRKKIDIEDIAMISAKGIVDRAEMRKNDENLKKENKNKKHAWWLPRHKNKNMDNNDAMRIQEDKDAKKLDRFKNVLNGSSLRGCCPDNVKRFLDEKLPGWKSDNDEISLEFAKAIVERANLRKKDKNLEEENENGIKRRLHWWLPRRFDNENERNTEELEQEHSDACKLGNLRQALKGSKNSKCSSEVSNYLDEHLQGWRKTEYKKQSKEERNLYKNEWKKNKKNMKLSKPKTESEPQQETTQQKRQRNKSKLTELHRTYKTMKSSTLAERFQQSPQEWHEYHEISEENEKSFVEEEIPRNQIINEMNHGIISRKKKEVVDLGCGKAQISKYFKDSPRFNFTNYDLVACDDSVTVCDISKTPLEDNSVDIAILSLAMWCTNREDNIQEAYRILDSQGLLFISEATKKWSELDENGNIVEGTEASKLIDMLQRNGFHIKKRKIEKFCMFVCVKR